MRALSGVVARMVGRTTTSSTYRSGGGGEGRSEKCEEVGRDVRERGRDRRSRRERGMVS